ncbi:AmmeMemoRadiSam system protein A [Candidatus Woesearchaeota archaeon]|nr:AmmeMemoRadiSam system protein A [Candidatus Woesearchaeota archaeon]
MMEVKQAEKLVKLARKSISAYFKGEDVKTGAGLKKEFDEKSGVFVSLYIDDELVGCIGYVEPTMPLWESVVQAAQGAAFEDPRFPPLTKKQYKKLKIEISVLSKLREIDVKKPSEYLSKIKIGKDGLVIKDEFGYGILLPQVAKDWDWGPEEFLNQTCLKAGLSPDCWNNMKRNVYKFQAQVFTEDKGRVVEKKLY